MAGGVPAAARLEQVPGALLGLVDPDFDQAGGGNGAVLVNNVVNLAQTSGKRLVVVAQFGKHVQRFDVLRIVVQHALKARDASDRPERGSTHLADAVGNRVGHREKLGGLFVQHQVVVAEMRAAYMPV